MFTNVTFVFSLQRPSVNRRRNNSSRDGNKISIGGGCSRTARNKFIFRAIHTRDRFVGGAFGNECSRSSVHSTPGLSSNRGREITHKPSSFVPRLSRRTHLRVFTSLVCYSLSVSVKACILAVQPKQKLIYYYILYSFTQSYIVCTVSFASRVR